MSDNISVTPGAGAVVAAESIDGALLQRVKLAIGGSGVDIGDVSTTNPMPISMVQSVKDATTNSSTTNLASGATFTGTSSSTLGVAYIQYSFKCDQTCKIYIDQGIDPTGTNWDKTWVETIPGGTGAAKSQITTGSYFRIRVTNLGPSLSTYFRLGTFLCPMANQADTLNVGGGMMTSFYPNFANAPTGQDAKVKLDIHGCLMTRGPTFTDGGSYTDDYGGATLTTTPFTAGTLTFKNGLNIITGIGTTFTSLISTGQYIRSSLDTDPSFTQIMAVLSDTALELATPYTGTSGVDTGASVVSNYTRAIGTGTSISVGSGNLVIASGTTTASSAYVFRSCTSLNIQLLFRSSLSQRIANQTFVTGLQDLPVAPTVRAHFSFSGTSNTQVDCVVNTSTVTSSQTITIPGGLTTASLLNYEVRLTQTNCVFYINNTKVALFPCLGWSSYQSLGIYIGSLNGTSPATTTSLAVNSLLLSCQNIMDVVCHNGDASKFQATVNTVANAVAPVLSEGSTNSLSMDLNSGLRVVSTPIDGQKTTFSATSAIAFASVASATDIFIINGSATKTIRVLRMGFSATQTTAAAVNVLLIKRSTANSGGTAAAATIVPHDSADTGSAVVQNYTANSTPGTPVGTVRAIRAFIPTTTLAATTQYYDFIFGNLPEKAIVLRGVAQGLALNLNGVTVTGGAFSCWVEWTEE